MVCYFTSITSNYLAKARVLGKTLKQYNPEATFFLVLSDTLPEFINEKDEPFDKILYPEHFSRMKNYDEFSFKHTVTELCTAVKGMAALEIMDIYNASAVIYLDPDIAVFNSLKNLEIMFENSSILLTPHQRKPETLDEYIRESEILFLKRGTYNFGFFGVKNDSEGRKFLEWWNQRLSYYCFDDDLTLLSELSHDGLLGMFTDQKWGDLIPSYFNNYKIIRDAGYNVCTWNMNDRIVCKQKNSFLVDSGPLYFFHFSGFDSGGHKNELLKRLYYDNSNKDILLLSEWYSKQLIKNGQEIFQEIEKKDNYYSNGIKIQDVERKIYHIRKDIYSIMGNPFIVKEGLCFYNWVRKEYSQYFYNDQNKTKRISFFKKTIIKYFPAWTLRGKFIRKLIKQK